MVSKISIQDMQKLAEVRGIERTGKPGKCLTKKYVNAHTYLEWECGKCSNKWKATPNNIKRGSWCPNCAGKMRKTINDMFELAKKRGLERTGKPGKCLSIKYKNAHTLLKWECGGCGNIWKATPTNIQRGRWCSLCAGKAKLSIRDMKKLAKKRGLERSGKLGKCISKIYINNRTHLVWQCGNCSKKWKATPHNIQRGTWCPNCSQGYSERVCRSYFEVIFKKKFPKASRLKWLISTHGNPMDLDGYNEELNLAFEYQGIQHYEYMPHFFHNNLQEFKRQVEDDNRKKEICKNQGITLICVPYWIDFDELQDFIIQEYERMSNNILPELPIFDHRNFKHPQKRLDKYMR